MSKQAPILINSYVGLMFEFWKLITPEAVTDENCSVRIAFLRSPLAASTILAMSVLSFSASAIAFRALRLGGLSRGLWEDGLRCFKPS